MRVMRTKTHGSMVDDTHNDVHINFFHCRPGLNSQRNEDESCRSNNHDESVKMARNIVVRMRWSINITRHIPPSLRMLLEVRKSVCFPPLSFIFFTLLLRSCIWNVTNTWFLSYFGFSCTCVTVFCMIILWNMNVISFLCRE